MAVAVLAGYLWRGALEDPDKSGGSSPPQALAQQGESPVIYLPETATSAPRDRRAQRRESWAARRCAAERDGRGRACTEADDVCAAATVAGCRSDSGPRSQAGAEARAQAGPGTEADAGARNAHCPRPLLPDARSCSGSGTDRRADVRSDPDRDSDSDSPATDSDSDTVRHAGFVANPGTVHLDAEHAAEEAEAEADAARLGRRRQEPRPLGTAR